MRTAIETIIHELTEARQAATMERMSLGFPNDRIEVKSVHFGDDRTGRVGDVLHPDEYVKNITKLHHRSWIIGPIDRALTLLEHYQEVIDRAEKLSKLLADADLEKLAHLAKGARREVEGY